VDKRLQMTLSLVDHLGFNCLEPISLGANYPDTNNGPQKRTMAGTPIASRRDNSRLVAKWRTRAPFFAKRDGNSPTRLEGLMTADDNTYRDRRNLGREVSTCAAVWRNQSPKLLALDHCAGGRTLPQ